MGRIINFPKKSKESANSVIFMQNYIKSHIIDLTQQRKELLRIKDELVKMRRRLEIKLIKDESGPGTA